MTQLSLAQAAADEAIERVDAHAHPKWMVYALQSVYIVATKRDEFTTDAVWAVLERWQGTQTHEPRAMGAVLRNAKARGWVEPTGAYRPSVRVECHGRPVRVWRSRL